MKFPLDDNSLKALATWHSVKKEKTWHSVNICSVNQ